MKARMCEWCRRIPARGDHGFCVPCRLTNRSLWASAVVGEDPVVEQRDRARAWRREIMATVGYGAATAAAANTPDTDHRRPTSTWLPDNVPPTIHADVHGHARMFWTPSFGAPLRDVERVPPRASRAEPR